MVISCWLLVIGCFVGFFGLLENECTVGVVDVFFYSSEVKKGSNGDDAVYFGENLSVVFYAFAAYKFAGGVGSVFI